MPDSVPSSDWEVTFDATDVTMRMRELEPGMDWRMEALRAKQTVRLRARALSLDADSYRLEVKWAG